MKKISILAILLPAVALANGYDVPNVNPRDLSMAGSLVASQGDAAAAYANPAALAKVDGLSLALAGSYLDLTTKFSGMGGTPLANAPLTKTKWKPAPPVSLFAAYGTQLFGRQTGVGFGMNIPGGGNVFWNDYWAGRGHIITVDRKLYGFYLSAGHALSEYVRLGGGVNYIHTQEYLKQGIQPFADAYGELSTSGGGFGYDVSVDASPVPGVFTLGVDYKHQVRMSLEGDGNFVVPDALLQPSPSNPAARPPVDQGVKHVLTFPNVLNVGFSYRPAKPMLITGAWTFNRYSVYKDDTFVGSKGTTISVPRFYKNGYTFRLGAEWDVAPGLKLRAGALRDISGIDEDFYSPSLPDSNAWAATAGAGWSVTPDLTVQAAVFHAWLDRIAQTRDTAMTGDFQTRALIVSAGISYRLGM